MCPPRGSCVQALACSTYTFFCSTQSASRPPQSCGPPVPRGWRGGAATPPPSPQGLVSREPLPVWASEKHDQGLVLWGGRDSAPDRRLRTTHIYVLASRRPDPVDPCGGPFLPPGGSEQSVRCQCPGSPRGSTSPLRLPVAPHPTPVSPCCVIYRDTRHGFRAHPDPRWSHLQVIRMMMSRVRSPSWVPRFGGGPIFGAAAPPVRGRVSLGCRPQSGHRGRTPPSGPSAAETQQRAVSVVTEWACDGAGEFTPQHGVGGTGGGCCPPGEGSPCAGHWSRRGRKVDQEGSAVAQQSLAHHPGAFIPAT